ncbi:prepilin peptidase [Pinisolibacter aquiterrae]|uniref:prepilin peptidase n=1 Tax=Pinisolibacter aquiterrae TaxID=2815579 RepID=UPI001C3D8DC8|nr:A24 family peptidase [Pinisolibacter aquiterrae]MBV5266599.1 prepilin peptidase [Pinisolibacter aquiterrae]MCC8234628.1 A24 family peptidase [Pinisolibacter aquiterrae]
MGASELAQGAAIVVGLAAAVSDATTGRIPNRLTYPAIALGLLLGAWGGGASGLLASALGLVAASILFLIAFLRGGAGGGDVKIMAALGALVALPTALSVLAHALLVGAVMAVLGIVWRDRAVDLSTRLFGFVLALPGGLGRILGLPGLGRILGLLPGPDGETAAEGPPEPGVRFGVAAGLGVVWAFAPAGLRLPVGIFA